MESIIINPKTKKEVKLVRTLLEKMNISSDIISEEEKEDLGLIAMMKEADRNETVSREEIIKKLKS